MPEVIEAELRNILGVCPETSFTINLSLDGVGDKHDEIRGVKGNFQSFLRAYNSLSGMKKEFSNLILGVHTVVSIFNLESLAEIYRFVRNLQPDSYIVEVAEERTELFNQGMRVTPNPKELAKVMRSLRTSIRHDYLRSGGIVARLIQASRLAYYEEVPKILESSSQSLPCYAGFASCQITPYGDVWPCCVLGYDQTMGNLRETDYDFGKIWFAERAQAIRCFIRDGRCSCPLANAWYTSVFCSPHRALKVMAVLVASYL